MRVFVLTKKNIIFYCVMLMAALSIFITRWDSSVYVFNNNAELNSLPIYCVDKGEEKICAISFDAAWGNEDTEELIGFCQTWLQNMTGNPAASVPAGLGENNLPIGVQVVGRRYFDEDVFAVAYEIERRLPWDSYYKEVVCK